MTTQDPRALAAALEKLRGLEERTRPFADAVVSVNPELTVGELQALIAALEAAPAAPCRNGCEHPADVQCDCLCHLAPAAVSWTEEDEQRLRLNEAMTHPASGLGRSLAKLRAFVAAQGRRS